MTFIEDLTRVLHLQPSTDCRSSLLWGGHPVVGWDFVLRLAYTSYKEMTKCHLWVFIPECNYSQTKYIFKFLLCFPSTLRFFFLFSVREPINHPKPLYCPHQMLLFLKSGVCNLWLRSHMWLLLLTLLWLFVFEEKC